MTAGYRDALSEAVGAFWATRDSQAKEQGSRGARAGGTRAEVLAGQHLNALEELIVRVFVDAGLQDHMLDVRKRPVPGYFRKDKSWDIVVSVSGRVLAIIELKSQAGASIGNNFNNRTDEALGQTVDFWTAARRELIDAPLRPWVGYFMLLEDNNKTRRPAGKGQHSV